jgi:hypothetical protein
LFPFGLFGFALWAFRFVWLLPRPDALAMLQPQRHFHHHVLEASMVAARVFRGERSAQWHPDVSGGLTMSSRASVAVEFRSARLDEHLVVWIQRIYAIVLKSKWLKGKEQVKE